MILRMMFLGGLLVLAGCSNGETPRPTPIPVKVKVMFNKSIPATGALVVFHPTSAATEKINGGKPFGKVAEDGSLLLTTYVQDDGAPEGEYGVTVDWRGPPKEAKKFVFTVGDSEGSAAGASKLKPKYGNPQQPVLKATVKKGDANDFTFYVD